MTELAETTETEQDKDCEPPEGLPKTRDDFIMKLRTTRVLQRKFEPCENDPEPKIYPTYAAFCDRDQWDSAQPEKLRGFKPARVSIWLAREDHFKTDRKNDILYYGDELKGVWTPDGEVKLKEICGVILGEENRSIHYTNILHDLKSRTYDDVAFSQSIACTNGALDVETREFKPFSLDLLTLHSIPTAYNPSAKCPHFLEFLKQVLNPEDIPTLQEWSGYLLLPDYRFHKLMWLHGAGRNGKGVWQRTMEGVLGAENVSSVGLEEFDGNHRFAMRQLYAKLFNPCSEPTTNRVLGARGGIMKASALTHALTISSLRNLKSILFVIFL